MAVYHNIFFILLLFLQYYALMTTVGHFVKVVAAAEKGLGFLPRLFYF